MAVCNGCATRSGSRRKPIGSVGVFGAKAIAAFYLSCDLGAGFAYGHCLFQRLAAVDAPGYFRILTANPDTIDAISRGNLGRFVAKRRSIYCMLMFALE